MKQEHDNRFEIKIDINNAGDLRTLTIVPEGKTFSILLNEISIAQIERSQTEKGNWHVRFSNVCQEDLEKIQEAINIRYPWNSNDSF